MRVETDRRGRCFQSNACLLQELAMEGSLNRLVALHAPSGKVPARLMAMAHEQYAALRVHNPARTPSVILDWGRQF